MSSFGLKLTVYATAEELPPENKRVFFWNKTTKMWCTGAWTGKGFMTDPSEWAYLVGPDCAIYWTEVPEL